jgi:hypothetical protein
MEIGDILTLLWRGFLRINKKVDIRIQGYVKSVTFHGAIDVYTSERDSTLTIWECKHTHDTFEDAISCTAEELARRFPEAEALQTPK